MVKSSDLCSLCKFVIGLVDNDLKSSATKADVENALKSVCDKAGILKAEVRVM